MTTPAIALYVPTYATRSPYITPTEYKNAGTGVDWSEIVPGGSAAVNAAALLDAIAKASSWADSLCAQVLCATLDVQAGLYRVKRGGTIEVPVDYTPVIAVTGVSWGYRPGAMTAMTDLSDVWPNGKVVEIPLIPTGVITNLTPPPSPSRHHGKVYASVQYVNGYANTTLAAQAAQGASSVTVASGFGLVPGLPITINDAANTEAVTVAQSYVFGSTTVPLTSSLLFQHSAGTSFSALPQSIKDAVTHLTSAKIKTRGSDAIELSAIHETPDKAEGVEDGGMSDLEIAIDLLGPFRRVI